MHWPLATIITVKGQVGSIAATTETLWSIKVITVAIAVVIVPTTFIVLPKP